MFEYLISCVQQSCQYIVTKYTTTTSCNCPWQSVNFQNAVSVLYKSIDRLTRFEIPRYCHAPLVLRTGTSPKKCLQVHGILDKNYRVCPWTILQHLMPPNMLYRTFSTYTRTSFGTLPFPQIMDKGTLKTPTP